MIRVLIAEAHPPTRSRIATLLAQEEMETVGSVSDSSAALHLCHLLQPDMLLFDLHLPGVPCQEVLRHLAKVCPSVAILVLSAYRDERVVEAMFQGNIQGVLLKEESPDLIVTAIRTVRTGQYWISPVVQSHLLGALAPWKMSLLLTPPEQTLWNLLAQGKDERTIAEELRLSVQIVRHNTHQLYTRLGVCTRGDIARRGVFSQTASSRSLR